jgi:hypothetical protein
MENLNEEVHKAYEIIKKEALYSIPPILCGIGCVTRDKCRSCRQNIQTKQEAYIKVYEWRKNDVQCV